MRRRQESQRKLLDLWQAPAGAGPAVALFATTFTFEEEFFESECLARFAGIEGRQGEGRDLEYLIELEERLSEIDASILIDRSASGEGHSLRFDVVPVAVDSGLLHAKAALLVWKGWVRLLVGSANLTRAGYRTQLEAMSVFDACPGTAVPRSLFDEAMSALEEISLLIPDDGFPTGPRQRALRTLSAARRELASLSLPSAWPGRFQAKVLVTRPGRPALDELVSLWRGGPPRNAMVFAPFFDTGEGTNLPISTLAGKLALRGPRTVTVALPVEQIHSKTVVRAPRSLISAVPKGADLQICVFAHESDEVRWVHAKGTLLESDSWFAALFGSSNFTTAGLGLHTRMGHVELNVALAGPVGEAEGKELLRLFSDRVGDDLDPDSIEWLPAADDEENVIALPLGFVAALVDPGPPPKVLVQLRVDQLPKTWWIRSDQGVELLAATHLSAGEARLEIPLLPETAPLPLALIVSWIDDGVRREASWPLNITDRGKLPPREELRALSSDEIIRVLSATRPLHASLAAVLAARTAATSTDESILVELDPHKRYSTTGQLFARTRDFTRALIGLRNHLSRPAPSIDSLRWRLELAPWSPKALAEALLREIDRPTALSGEAAFRLAELARTLRSVDWAATVQGLDKVAALKLVNQALAALRKAEVPPAPDARLDDYVREALAGDAR